MIPEPLAPHPPLERYYTHGADRERAVADIFNEGARHYELVCRLMSFGTGEQYRAHALRKAGLAPGMRLLDIATGTGLVLRSGARSAGPTGLAIGLDPSAGMLRECRVGSSAPVVQAVGERLPFAAQSFDMISMGYGLRHTADLRALFSEFYRVLRPGGRLLVLEITQPASSVGRRLNRLYLRTLVPLAARLITGEEAAKRMMDYFWDTIENCVPPEVIAKALEESGFHDASRGVTGGILSEYQGTRL